jgi:hypothetical protein
MKELQSVRVIFSDKKNNYSTSISADINMIGMLHYFKHSWFEVESYPSEKMEPSIDAFFLCRNFKADLDQNNRLKMVEVFYPDSNQRLMAIYDPMLNACLGFTNESIYHPAGGVKACYDIINGQDGSQGLVIGSVNQWHTMTHCHGDVFRIYVNSFESEQL